jgi:hypothetical protein
MAMRKIPGFILIQLILASIFLYGCSVAPGSLVGQSDKATPKPSVNDSIEPEASLIRVIPEAVYVISEGSFEDKNSEGEVVSSGKLIREEKQTQMVDDRTVEILMSINYEFEDGTEDEITCTKKLDIYTGVLVTVDCDWMVAEEFSTESRYLNYLGEDTTVRVGEWDYITYNDEDWKFDCTSSTYYHQTSYFLIRDEETCEVFDPEGVYFGTSSFNLEVVDTNLY